MNVPGGLSFYLMDRKRIIVLTILLWLILPGIMVKVNAEEKAHYHGNIKYEPWTGADMPKQGGYYYLTEDIVRSETAGSISIPAGTTQHLCLNGHTVTHCKSSDRLYTVKGNFYLEECSLRQGGIAYGGTKPSTCSYGGLINVQRGGDMTMTGGQIYGLSSTHETGAAIYIQGATTTASGTFHLLGGSIHGNTAAICMTRSVSRPATENFSQVYIGGGSIRDNGNAITVTGDVLRITGGQITDNRGDMPAIYVAEQTKISLSGRPYITGNQAGNLYLAGQSIIELEQLEPETRVGVSAEKTCRMVAVSQAEIPLGCFQSDDPQYGIVLREEGLFLGYDHEHPLIGAESVNWHKWTDGEQLPTVSGNYCLEQDVFLTEEAVVENGVALNLCLNGHSIHAPSGKRIMIVAAGAQVQITDCQEDCGSLTGGNSDFGGGFYIARQGRLTLHNGMICNNTAKEGGGIYLQAGVEEQPGGQFQMFGGQICENDATSGGGIYVGAGCTVLLAGGRISENRANRAGGVLVSDRLLVQGSTVVEGNSDNIYLMEQACLSVSELNPDARLFISAQNPDRPITDTAVDGKVAGCFFSDSQYQWIEHKEWIYLNRSRSHTHCNCNGNSEFCGHDQAAWQPWESAGQLPQTTGYYYLVTDVVLADQVGILNGEDVHLCLNGHTVTAAKGERLFQVHTDGKFMITDCVGSGKLTGGNREYGGAVNIMRGAVMALYGGSITDNCAGTDRNGLGGAVYLQGEKDGIAGGVFSMYGGEISGNIGYNGAIYASGGSRVVIRGGSISGNSMGNHGGGIFLASGAKADVENVTIEGNTAKKKGGGIYQSAGAEFTICNSRILRNTSMDTGSALHLGGEFVLDGCYITENTAMDGTAVYVAPATGGMRLMGGDLWIWGNTGTMRGDLYLGKGVIVTGTEDGFGRNTKICVQIYSGFLTDALLAAYHYEGGSRVYTVTYGNRSLTNPEKEPGVEETAPETKPVKQTAPIKQQQKTEETVVTEPAPVMEDGVLPANTLVGELISKSACGMGLVVASIAFTVALLRRRKPKKV